MHRRVILISIGTVQISWGKWKALRQRAEFIFKGPLRGEERWVGQKGRKVFSTWNMTDAEQKVLQNYYESFQTYVQAKSNPIFAKYRLHSKVQEPGGRCQQFVTALKLLVKDCEYGQAEVDIVEVRIMFGMKSAEVREQHIDTGADLTLEEALEIVRVEEISVQQGKQMKDEPDQEAHAVKTKPAWRHKDSKSNEYTHTHTYGRRGRQHGDSTCPASGKSLPEVQRTKSLREDV